MSCTACPELFFKQLDRDKVENRVIRFPGRDRQATRLVGGEIVHLVWE